MNGKLIFLYSDSDDVLIDIANTISSDLKKVEFIGIESIIDELRPEPWPIVIKNTFSAMLQDKFNNAIVVNRLFKLDSSIKNSKLLQYGKHELWIHIALMPLLENARILIHDVGTLGTSKSLLPLNTQWALMSDFGRNDVVVPQFVYGFGAETPDISGFKNPIQKSVWSIFDWKSEKHLSEDDKGWNQFFVESPTGNPVICHYLGLNNFWFSYPHNEKFTIDHQAFEVLVRRCSECFKSLVGEFLVFVEPDSNIIKFCAFSPHLSNAKDSEEFISRVEAWLSDITCTSNAH
jgi:hypothetical protein